MTVVRSPALRQALAALLLVVLTLAGVGRAAAVADAGAPRVVVVAGVAVQFCHPDAGSRSVPGAPGHHDCCDECALCAPLALTNVAPFAAPARVEHFAAHAAALPWAPAVARVSTPRLSQGPPAA